MASVWGHAGGSPTPPSTSSSTHPALPVYHSFIYAVVACCGTVLWGCREPPPFVPPSDSLEPTTSVFHPGLSGEVFVNLLSAATTEEGLIFPSSIDMAQDSPLTQFSPTRYFLGVRLQPCRNTKTPQRSP